MLDRRTDAVVTASDKFEHKLSKTATMTQSFSALWKAQDFGDALYTFAAGAAASLTTRTQMKIELLDTYASRPPTADGQEQRRRAADRARVQVLTLAVASAWRRCHPVSDHCDGERFFNPYATRAPVSRDVIKWRARGSGRAWPARVPLTSASRAAGRRSSRDRSRSRSSATRRSCSARRRPSSLTDPVFTSHAGPFGRLGPRARASAGDRPSPAAAGRPRPRQPQPLRSSAALVAAPCSRTREPTFVAPLGVPRDCVPPGGSYGLRERCIELDWWETSRPVGDGARSPACRRSTSRRARRSIATGRSGAASSSDVDGVTIYFAGDSGYSPHFAEIGRALSVDRPRAAADRRLRAALVHAAGAHESRGSGAGAPRPRRAASASACTSARSS